MAEKDTSKLDAQVQHLRSIGVGMPRSQARARLEAQALSDMASMSKEARHTDLLSVTSANKQAAEIEANTRLMRAMGAQRRVSHRKTSNTGGGGDAFAAIPRFYDPLEYWDLSGLPWNMADEGHRHKIHKWLRLYYSTHYLVPILIDIFTRFPLVGMELKGPDSSLNKFYEQLFIEDLNYPEFLVSLGREFWCIGEVFSLGSFDEDLGVWEHEELLNPEDIVVKNFPLLGSRQLELVAPEYLRKLAQTKSPAKEYKQLEINFPDLIPYLLKNEHIPMSEVLLKQVANRATSWDDHGTPILLRGLRTLIHEEKLLASQDAIAERLYSPMILAKLGIMDLGDGQGAWVPSPDELDVFRDDMDIALSSDFRLLVHHFGIEIQNVFGREQMPRLGDDFDRIERRLMQIFGVNPSLLSAGSSATPYASSALQAEFLNQILRTYQGYLKRHYRDRALVVAEAQGHYAYEKRGQTRVPIMEEYKEYDEDGGFKIVERHKLMIPDIEFAVLDMRDEANERQFLQTMRAMGIPIPDEKMMIGFDHEFPTLVDEYNEEIVQKTLAQQEAKVKAYDALSARNLPIPADLKAEVESTRTKGQPPMPDQQPPPPGGPPGGAPPGGPPPGGGMGMPGGGHGVVMPPPPMGPTGMGVNPNMPGTTPPMAPGVGGPGRPGNGFAPPASMERRPGMPTASVEKESSTNLDSEEIVSNIDSDDGLRVISREEKDKTVIQLPRNKKKYRIIDPE